MALRHRRHPSGIGRRTRRAQGQNGRAPDQRQARMRIAAALDAVPSVAIDQALCAREPAAPAGAAVKCLSAVTSIQMKREAQPMRRIWVLSKRIFAACSLAFAIPHMRFAIGIVVALSVGCAGAAPESAQASIEAAYGRADAAQVAAKTIADLEAIREWLDTQDCTYADYGQPPRRWSEMRAYAEEGLRTRLVTFNSRVQQFDLHGDSAIVTTLVQGVARVVDRDGQFGPRNAAHDVETTAIVRDEWVRAADRWRRRSHTKIVANRITMIDGAPASR